MTAPILFKSKHSLNDIACICYTYAAGFKYLRGIMKNICTTTHSDKTARKTEMVALLFKCRFESGAKSHLEVFLQGVLMTPEMTMIRH